jgi:hypothetical protein
VGVLRDKTATIKVIFMQLRVGGNFNMARTRHFKLKNLFDEMWE